MCMVPGHTVLNQFTTGANAICGGPSAGVLTLPITAGTTQVGRLLVWKSIYGSLYFTMLLDCASDGAVVSVSSGTI